MDPLQDRWQSSFKKLGQCLEHMRLNNISCDVTFVVGTTRDKIRAHKLVMISRSPVFYSMFEGPLAEADEVAIPDIEKDVFDVFLRYLYTDECDIDGHVAQSLMYTANKYMVDELTKLCVDYYMCIINPVDACALLEQSTFYDIPKLTKKCLRYICENATECLQSEAFLSLSQQSVCHITESDDLYLDEESLYEAAIRWSEAECKRSSTEVTDVNQREVLGRILYNIHFPAIDEKYFDKEIAKKAILSKEEKQWIKKLAGRMGKDPKPLFKKSDRTSRPSEYEQVLRLMTHSSQTFSPSGSTEAIAFEVSRDIWFHGILLYGHLNYNKVFNLVSVSLKLTDEDSDVVSFTQNCEIIETENCINEILLEIPFRVRSGERYEVTVGMGGSFVSWCGCDGQPIIQFHDCEVEFYNSPDVNITTTVTDGQIPGLLLSVMEE